MLLPCFCCLFKVGFVIKLANCGYLDASFCVKVCRVLMILAPRIQMAYTPESRPTLFRPFPRSYFSLLLNTAHVHIAHRYRRAEWVAAERAQLNGGQCALLMLITFTNSPAFAAVLVCLNVCCKETDKKIKLRYIYRTYDSYRYLHKSIPTIGDRQQPF